MKKIKLKILILGSGGFIGSQLRLFFENNVDYDCIGISSKKIGLHKNDITIEDFVNNYKNYEYLFKDIDIVINSIGLAHDTKNNKLIQKYEELNVKAPTNFYKLSNKYSVKKFIHLSTIMVYGNKNYKKPINEYQNCAPDSVYGKSKLKGDNELLNLQTYFNTKLFIIRLPLVLGQNPRGNLNTLLNYCNSNYPLPFKNISNIKSYITIFTLFDFIKTLIKNNITEKNLILISEKNNISLEKLIIIYKKIFKRKNNLFYLNPYLFKILFFIFLKKNLYYKIFNSLYYDTSKYKKLYNWEPKNNLEINLIKSLSVNLNKL